MILHDRKNKNIRFADVVTIWTSIYHGDYSLIKNIFIEEYPELEYIFEKYSFGNCSSFGNQPRLPKELDNKFIGHCTKIVFYEKSYTEHKILFGLFGYKKEPIKINSGYCILFDNLSKVFLDIKNEEIKIFIKRLHKVCNQNSELITNNFPELSHKMNGVKKCNIILN